MKTKNNNQGFTLIELLVVIAIIGLLSTLGLVALQNARQKARDAKRITDIKEIEKALELFFNTNNRYPNVTDDGINVLGEVLGDNEGPIEIALDPFLKDVPADIFGDGTADQVDDFFYAYDPDRGPPCSGAGLTINSFEGQAAVDQYGRQDITTGANMFMNTAHYSRCLQE